MSLKDTSKFISLILRRKQEAISIALDEQGCVNVDELIARIEKTRPMNMEMLEEIVRMDNKQCYSFSKDKALLHANQGPSIPVEVSFRRQSRRNICGTVLVRSQSLRLIYRDCFYEPFVCTFVRRRNNCKSCREQA